MINDCVTPLAHHRPLPSLQMLPPASLRPDHKDLKHKHKKVIRVVDKYLNKKLNPTKLLSLHVHNLRLKEMVKEIAQNEFDHLFVF